jgi:hypothetical protein
MTFRLEHHNKILTVLESLDASLLRESFAYLGGGTLIALDLGGYRWNVSHKNTIFFRVQDYTVVLQ